MQELNSSNSSMTTRVLPGNLVASVVLGFCFVLGVPGNIAVIVRLAGWLERDSFTPRLMLSLAVSDLVTLLPLPMWISSLLFGWMFGLFLCKFLSYVVSFSLYCSTLCVILMSVQRYLQVLHLEKWAKLGERGQMILVSGMWMLSGVLAFYAVVQYTVCLGEDGQLHCETAYLNDTERISTLLWESLMFLVSFFLLAIFYFLLHKGVNRSAFFNSHTLAKLVSRIVVTFFIFWVPYIINNVALITALLLRNDRLLRATEAGRQATAALPFINSCVNPFLYAFSAPALQQQAPGSETT